MPTETIQFLFQTFPNVSFNLRIMRIQRKWVTLMQDFDE